MFKKILFAIVFLIGSLLPFYASAQNKTAPKKEAAKTQQKTPAVKKHPDVDYSISCFECHQTATPEIAAKWESGKHGQVNVGCFVCHDDGEVEFFNKPKGDRCIGCHSQKEVNFTKLPVKTCFGCHGGHDLKFHQEK